MVTFPLISLIHWAEYPPLTSEGSWGLILTIYEENLKDGLEPESVAFKATSSIWDG